MYQIIVRTQLYAQKNIPTDLLLETYSFNNNSLHL